jgi:hypothetical protein
MSLQSGPHGFPVLRLILEVVHAIKSFATAQVAIARVPYLQMINSNARTDLADIKICNRAAFRVVLSSRALILETKHRTTYGWLKFRLKVAGNG